MCVCVGGGGGGGVGVGLFIFDMVQTCSWNFCDCLFILSANNKIYTYSYICLTKGTLFKYHNEDFMTIHMFVLGVKTIK